jgi:hypothetical protein
LEAKPEAAIMYALILVLLTTACAPQSVGVGERNARTTA